MDILFSNFTLISTYLLHHFLLICTISPYYEYVNECNPLNFHPSKLLPFCPSITALIRFPTRIPLRFLPTIMVPPKNKLVFATSPPVADSENQRAKRTGMHGLPAGGEWFCESRRGTFLCRNGHRGSVGCGRGS